MKKSILKSSIALAVAGVFGATAALLFQVVHRRA